MEAPVAANELTRTPVGCRRGIISIICLCEMGACMVWKELYKLSDGDLVVTAMLDHVLKTGAKSPLDISGGDWCSILWLEYDFYGVSRHRIKKAMDKVVRLQQSIESLRFKCPICGKLTAGRKPRHGDWTYKYPRRHKGVDGKLCPGSFREAEWVLSVISPR